MKRLAMASPSWWVRALRGRPDPTSRFRTAMRQSLRLPSRIIWPEPCRLARRSP